MGVAVRRQFGAWTDAGFSLTFDFASCQEIVRSPGRQSLIRQRRRYREAALSRGVALRAARQCETRRDLTATTHEQNTTSLLVITSSNPEVVNPCAPTVYMYIHIFMHMFNLSATRDSHTTLFTKEWQIENIYKHKYKQPA